MTDKRCVGLRHRAGGVRESRSRNSKLSAKTKRQLIGLKDSQSPSCQNSYSYRKDFTTPKRRPRIRFNGCCSGESPNETETLQDIIWDPNSPTQNFNGKGVNGKVIEISEIVNRIAPKVERPKEGDSVLQWIGDNAIPCTPEVRQPRVRKISARQSNVEDLMKLAKQFDINMTRQDKERQQNATEEMNKLNKAKSDRTVRTELKLPSVPVKTGVSAGLSQARQEEEALQALFDGPTQHLSGRLSPPSVSCTPETRPNPVALFEPGTSSPAVRNAPVDAPKATGMDFDDDWENDDLLSNSFVLEMTQNPVPSNAAQKQSIAQPNCSSRNSNIAANPSVSNGRGVCQQIQKSTGNSSTFTKTFPKGQMSVQSTSRLKPPASAQNQTTKKLLSTLLVVQGKQPAQSSHGNKQAELDKATKDCRSSSQPSTSKFEGVSKDDLQFLFDSDGLWNDEDDDLLCQACNDVERISVSQEQQRQSMGLTEPAHNTSKAPSFANTIQTQTVHINGKSQPGQPTTSTRTFVRSNSVPCSSGSSGFKQNSGVLPTHGGFSTGSGSYHYKQAQNKQTQGKSALGPKPGSVRATDTPQTILPQNTKVGNSSNSHNFTFKRHLSDSVTLTNKVFVSSNGTVKCSAAEIERKKQEAIARRRLRMQASQKQGAPT